MSELKLRPPKAFLWAGSRMQRLEVRGSTFFQPSAETAHLTATSSGGMDGELTRATNVVAAGIQS